MLIDPVRVLNVHGCEANENGRLSQWRRWTFICAERSRVNAWSMTTCRYQSLRDPFMRPLHTLRLAVHAITNECHSRMRKPGLAAILDNTDDGDGLFGGAYSTLLRISVSLPASRGDQVQSGAP